MHRLNLDPRFRVPANFGTEVVEQNAEEYMNYAWEQIGDVLQANHNDPATALRDRSVAAPVCTATSDPVANRSASERSR